MKHKFILLISALLFYCPVDAQERVIDSTDRSPIERSDPKTGGACECRSKKIIALNK